jgi:hypothetical protein
VESTDIFSSRGYNPSDYKKEMEPVMVGVGYRIIG